MIDDLPPDALHIRWHRLDVPGREVAWITRVDRGWRLTGEVDVTENGSDAHLRYAVDCDQEWRTRAAVVEGTAGGHPVGIRLFADAQGQWRHDDRPAPHVRGALDIDLGFTPATNTLPIRRLSLAVGDSVAVRSAWLRFPELVLEPLDQVYTRETERRYRYRSTVDGEPFTAMLEVDAFGRVLRYGELWQAEVAGLPQLPL